MADYSAIITAIDDAILVWAGQPVEIDHNGKKTVYRSLDELMRARAMYAGLAAQSSGRLGFAFVGLKNGGPRTSCSVE